MGESEGSKFEDKNYGIPVKALVIPLALPIGHALTVRGKVSTHNITQLDLFMNGEHALAGDIYGISPHNVAVKKYQTVTAMNNYLATSDRQK